MTGTVAAYKSPLHQMTQTTRTCLWNDSASLQELAYSLGHGAVGATCNPVPPEFDSFPPTRRTLRQFIAACHELDGQIREVLIPNPDEAKVTA
jgi:hypothetical protein